MEIAGSLELTTEALFPIIDKITPGTYIDLPVPPGIAFSTFRTQLFIQLKSYPLRASIKLIAFETHGLMRIQRTGTGRKTTYMLGTTQSLPSTNPGLGMSQQEETLEILANKTFNKLFRFLKRLGHEEELVKTMSKRDYDKIHKSLNLPVLSLKDMTIYLTCMLQFRYFEDLEKKVSAFDAVMSLGENEEKLEPVTKQEPVQIPNKFSEETNYKKINTFKENWWEEVD